VQSTTIPGDPVVLVVTAQLRNEIPMLIGNLAVTVAPEPLATFPIARDNRLFAVFARSPIPDRDDFAASNE
jgi:hypothetical protein